MVAGILAERSNDEPDAVTFDPEAVRGFEHAGWQQAAGDYDTTFARATGGFVDALIDADGIAGEMQVLDLCCGTGIVSAAIALRGAIPMGVDFSPAMLGRARAKHPELRFEHGDAEALPCADVSFDAVVSNFGMHHVPRPERAAGEVMRVLRRGGRFAFTTWAAPVENIAWRLLFDAIRADGDPNAAKTPPSGGNLGQVDAVSLLLARAGFTDIRVEDMQREWRLASAAELVSALRRGTVRTAAVISAQREEALPAITAHIADAMNSYRKGDAFAVPIVAILASGTKSAA
jgi:ubiquinone/menaquinone biosynthesis C-methylase UbiE